MSGGGGGVSCLAFLPPSFTRFTLGLCLAVCMYRKRFFFSFCFLRDDKSALERDNDKVKRQITHGPSAFHAAGRDQRACF